MTLPHYLHLSVVFLFTAMTLACAGAAAPMDKPRLVVVLVIDGLPQRQVTAYRDQLADDGLARFLDRGAWFADAHHGHAVTVTCAGHAAILTGAYPHRTGIIANEWRDLSTGERRYCAGDPQSAYIGHATERLDGTSPRNLKVETLGDVLRRADARAKVIAIAGKDRGAIMPAGKTGTAYMYMRSSGLFASSTFYMKQHPAWVDAFNARKPADRYFKAEWKPLLPEAAYAGSVPDGASWFRPGRGGLPMMMNGSPDNDTPGPAFYSRLLASPFVDALTLEFALAAVAGEQLGRDDAPDILAVSLSGHDYVNHRWSAESRLSHDHLLQVDGMLQAFLRELDARVGRANYLAVLTSDHGFMPSPDYSRAKGEPAGRLSTGEMLDQLNADLEQRFGVPRLVAFTSASALVLDRARMAQSDLGPDVVAKAARDILLANPAIAAAYTRNELHNGSRAGAPLFEGMRRSWHGDISGDVQFALKPNWMWGNAVATHGSPHAYDTHVPLMLWGPRWLKPGRIDSSVAFVDLAPTLARLLGVPPPSASQGQALPLSAP